MNLSETAEVLEAISRLKSEDRALALATIVSVRGSTYRRPGARLLVPEEGQAVGNLSGGCLEGDVEGIEAGRRLVLYPSGEKRGSLGDSSLDEAAMSACERGLVTGITDVVEVDFSGGRARLFVEVLKPPLRLLVCGAGHDAIPLVA